MAYVNVAEWSPRHVAEWLRGLDDTVQPYVQFFLNNNINGCHLLTLASSDLVHLNVVKIGHQEIILEAVDLLRQLHYNLTSENLQSLCLKLGCKARSLCIVLKQKYSSMEKGKNLVSTGTLSSVSDILALVKILISWLDRYPFEGQDEYKTVRKTILQHSIELASTAQRDQFAEKPHEIIQKNCHNIAEQCDTIVQKFNDSLIIQPASLKVATVKKRSDEDMGIHIHSSYSGIHIIGAVKFQSPAYHCGKVCEGDEIIQVNYQTVVGWQLKNLVCATNEHPSEIHLTIKKRPHHSNALEEVFTMWPFRIPSKRTAFRKMNKWPKSKSSFMPVSEVYSSSSMNFSQQASNNALHGSVTVRQPQSQQLNPSSAPKRRPRLNRRATIDSIPHLKMHSHVNIPELKSAFKIVEPSGVSEKYSTYNAKKTSDSDRTTSPRVFYPVVCKFGNADSEKWNRGDEENHRLIDNDIENSKVKCASPVCQQEVSRLKFNHGEYNSENSTSDDAMGPGTENTERISHHQPSLSNGSVHSNLSNTSPSIKQHSKLTKAIPEEKTCDVEGDMLGCEESSSDYNINLSTEVAEDIMNSTESDDKSETTRFQVVSLPSPGANTRTFIRQNKRSKKSSQDIIVLGETNETDFGKHILPLNNQSHSDLSEGQSDTSIEDIIVGNKCVKEESTETFCQPNGVPIYNSEPTNKKNNSSAREEMLSYRKKKNTSRPQRRFTADQSFFPKQLQLDPSSAFKPISLRSLSCIDVSQITEFSANSKYLPSQKFPSLANEEMHFSSQSQNEQNIECCPMPNFKASGYINLLDQRTIQPQHQSSNGALTEEIDKPLKNSTWKQKEPNVSAGYVAKIAESFNLITRQQREQLKDHGSDSSHYSVPTGQLYKPVPSYASVMKPKPLRGDQLFTFVQNRHDASIHENNTITPQESQCFQPTKFAAWAENCVKDSRKEPSDFKQANRLLRTATSEEIQNMYTTYGNSGRAFESKFINGNTTCTMSVKENGKVDNANKQKPIPTKAESRCLEFQTIAQNKNVSIRKCQKQATEQLSEKLMTLIFGEKEEHTPPLPINQPTELATVSKCRVSAAVQTDMLEDSHSYYEDSCLNISFASQESGHGNDKTCQNLSDDSLVYSSNNSITSSTSSGSHYYYVETHIRPELTISVPLTDHVLPEEISDCSRNSHLPRMGVAAMLGKKRTVSHASSDSGSGEVNARLEHTKEYSPTYKSLLGHSIVPIDV